MSAPVLRILSDLHYTDPGSWVHDLRVLRPVLDGADHVLVNGDATDTQVVENPIELVSELRAFFQAQARQVTFLTGNHDPDISDTHECSLAGGQIWVTHGDVLFDDVAPWGRLAPEFRRRIRLHTAALAPGEFARIETRFRIFRQVCLKLPREHDPTARGTSARLKRIFNAVFPPGRLIAMLRVWRDFPEIAAQLTAGQRPDARVVITGHTHHRGIWRRPSGHTIINTGSFCPPKNGFVVDVTDEQGVVREVTRRNGEFRLGGAVAHFALAPRPVSAITAPR